VAFEQAKQEITDLRARAQAGEIEVAYLDEAGFAPIHPNRSAWTPIGEQHGIEATRGTRLNVVAALLSSGKVFSAKLWCSFTAPLFAGFVGLLKEQVTKPLTIILDNASVHTARAIEPLMQLLRRQGVTLYFLPPYCPELNRIEQLWHLVKHSWMPAKHRDAPTLERDVGEILDHIGTRYHMAF
jgi:hypothetical protein